MALQEYFPYLRRILEYEALIEMRFITNPDQIFFSKGFEFFFTVSRSFFH